MSNTLDVVVRFHDARRINELERSVFSLIGQAYRPLNVHISVQRFDDQQLDRIRGLVGLMTRLGPDICFHILNHTAQQPVDARSALVNAGFQNASGRYLAILDYDDVIKAGAYCRLIADLASTDAAISFGKIIAKKVQVDGPIFMVKSKNDTISGEGLRALFHANFCPIHSFVIDRSKVEREDLFFDTNLDRNEDYDFLIRFCSKYPSSFNLKDYVVGDYSMKDDGSNTIIVPESASDERLEQWRRAEAAVGARRAVTQIAARVQQQLGLGAIDPSLTVQELLRVDK